MPSRGIKAGSEVSKMANTKESQQLLLIAKMSTYKIFNKYVCICGMPSPNQRLMKSHLQRNPSHRLIAEDVIMEETSNPVTGEVPCKYIQLIHQMVFLTFSFVIPGEIPTVESLEYFTSCTFERPHGNAHVFDVSTNARFNETELNSIQFREIIDTYAIPREASRKLIYLFQTIMRNNLEGAEFKSGKIFFKKNKRWLDIRLM